MSHCALTLNYFLFRELVPESHDKVKARERAFFFRLEIFNIFTSTILLLFLLFINWGREFNLFCHFFYFSNFSTFIFIRLNDLEFSFPGFHTLDNYTINYTTNIYPRSTILKGCLAFICSREMKRPTQTTRTLIRFLSCWPSWDNLIVPLKNRFRVTKLSPYSCIINALLRRQKSLRVSILFCTFVNFFFLRFFIVWFLEQ